MKKVIEAAGKSHANVNEFLTFCKRIKAAANGAFESDDDVVAFSEVFFKKMKIAGGDLEKRQMLCLGMINLMANDLIDDDGKSHEFINHMKDDVVGMSIEEARPVFINEYISKLEEVTKEFNKTPRVMAAKYREKMPEVELFL